MASSDFILLDELIKPLQRLVVGLDGLGESKVAFGVFMTIVDDGLIGEGA